MPLVGGFGWNCGEVLLNQLLTWRLFIGVEGVQDAGWEAGGQQGAQGGILAV